MTLSFQHVALSLKSQEFSFQYFFLSFSNDNDNNVNNNNNNINNNNALFITFLSFLQMLVHVEKLFDKSGRPVSSTVTLIDNDFIMDGELMVMCII